MPLRATFLGIDLGWYGKPSGLAALHQDDGNLRLGDISRLEDTCEILEWVRSKIREETVVVGVDAPLVIPNPTGIRPAERELNRDFRRFDAGCHAANLGRPFAANVLSFSAALSGMGFLHGAGMGAREAGRFQIEVHPNSAAVSLFHLPRIVKYKRGPRAGRSRELRRLRGLMTTRLPLLDPPVSPIRLPAIPLRGNLKPVEDRIDAVLCAYIAAHWWHWSTLRNRLYGCEAGGYIVVPGLGPEPHRPRTSETSSAG